MFKNFKIIGFQGIFEIQGLEYPSAKVCTLAPFLPAILAKRPVLWLTNSDLESREVSDLLTAFTIAHLTLSHHSANIELPMLCERLLSGTPGLIVCSNAFLEERFPRLDHFRAMRRMLTAGKPLSQKDLVAFLEEARYTHEDQAVLPGTYAVRGEIVDLFQEGNEEPTRLEFNGDVLECIKTFDPKTKRLRNAKQRMTIIPRELRERNGTFASFVGDTPPFVLFSEPDRMSLEYPEALEALESFEQLTGIAFTFLAPYAPSKTFIEVKATTPLPYEFQLPRLKAKLSTFLKQGYRIFIHTSREDKLKNVLPASKNITLIHRAFHSHVLSRGADAPESSLLWLEDMEIFGPDTRKSARGKIDTEFLSELKSGDFVVHLDHGIGRFTGMTRQIAEGVEREYYVLEYAAPSNGNGKPDRLFLPIEMSEKISKYIGSPEPKLHRLSGEHWFALTRTIQRDTLELAKELLAVAASREGVEVNSFTKQTEEESALAHSFVYEETHDQRKAIEDVMHDLQQSKPMDRVIAGDTGFGKTEVAIRAAFRAVISGAQVAVLCPTTILAQQHSDTFRDRLAALPVEIGELSRFQSAKQQREVLAKLRDGSLNVVIGTHRLLSGDVIFQNLCLIIIDEEQRFGVKDKEKLKKLRSEAHVLTLTATPIPRTLNQTLSGLREMSIISTPPLGRLSSDTIIKPHSESIIRIAVANELKREGQVYYVWNRVETIEEKAKEIRKKFPKARVGVAHGQLAPAILATIMHDFDEGKIDILVTSTIIENGLDIPNANTLIVEHATHFGLADLYQLKGRIGRSDRPSYAYFLYDAHKLLPEAKKRLNALLEARELGSGFRLAMRDLEIRGAGDLLGKKQHGHVTAIGLNLYTRLLEQAITELKTGQPAPTFRDVTVDLPQTNSIPRSIEPHEGRRLRLYQELANITKLNDLLLRKEELREHEMLPEELANLFDVLELKILAQPSEIIAIDTLKRNGENKIYLKGYATFHAGRMTALLEKQPYWEWSKEILKADLACLGQPWMPALKEAVKLLSLM